VRLLRAVLGRLDPWAALLLGVLLALGVIILLATPGPWHQVVGPAAPAQRAPTGPTDLAVFALGGAKGACTAVVWLHVDQARPALTAVVVAPATQGFVPGAGFMPLRRIVDQVGPGVAAAALGQALEIPMDAWITLDRQALRLALEPRSLAGTARGPLLQFLRDQAAWEGRGEASRVWSTQYKALGSTLARLPFERINIVSFSNYVLGWGHVQSNLDLQGATSLATMFRDLLPTEVDVRGAAAIVETCRRGEAWRLDRVPWSSCVSRSPSGSRRRRRGRASRGGRDLPACSWSCRGRSTLPAPTLRRCAGACGARPAHPSPCRP